MDIILIHGTSQPIHDEDVGSDFLKEKWINYIKNGFIKCNLDIDLLNDTEFKFLYYADLRNDIDPLVIDHEKSLDNVNLLLESQIKELSSDPEVQSFLKLHTDSSHIELDPKTLGIREFLIDKIVFLLQGKFKFIDKLFVKMIFREALYYMENPKYVQSIQKRLEKLIDKSKGYIIISHSLGSLVAYSHACLAQDKSIKTFVTMGSPLAIEFFKDLRKEPLIIPSAIEGKWINFYDKEDFVAVYPLQSPKYNINPEIINKEIKTLPKKPHNIQGYLESKDFCKILSNELIF